MPFLPVDTAVVVRVGPLVDDTDFKTLETAIAYNAAGMSVDLFVSDGTAITKTDLTLTSGGANDWTHKGNGVYELEITAAQNATEGELWVVGVCDGVLPFESPHYAVVPQAVFNSLVKGTDKLQVDAVEVSSDSAAADALELFVENAKGTDHKVLLSSDAQDLNASLHVDAKAISGSTTAADNVEANIGNLDRAISTAESNVRGADSDTLKTLSDQADAIKAKTDNLPASPAAVGSAMTLADDAITSAKFDESTAFPLKSADSGSTQVARTGADSDTLETLSDQLDLISGDVGPGADSIPCTFTCGGVGVGDAAVWVSTDSASSNVIAGSLRTDSNGQVTFMLTATNTYYVWAKKDGYNPILGSVISASTGGHSFSMTAATGAAGTGILMTDLYDRLLDRLPKNMAIRDFYGVVKYVEERIVERGDWSFFRKVGETDFIAPYTTGTVSATNGSTAIVGSGTTFTSAMAGRKIRIADGQEYEISSYTDATHITLTREYEGDTVTGQTYAIYQNVYSLASDVQTIDHIWDTTNQLELVCVTDEEAKTLDALYLSKGDCYRYATYGRDSSGYIRLYVQPYPTDAAHIVYYYRREHSSASSMSDRLDFPSTLSEVIVQGCYGRILSTHGLEGWQPQWNTFKKMLEERWATNAPARDFAAEAVRAGDTIDYMGPTVNYSRRITET